MYDLLPPQRRLNPDEAKYAAKALSLNVNKKLLQKKFVEKGKNVKIKSLTNIQQQQKRKSSINDLFKLYEMILDKYPGINYFLLIHFLF